jgi:hypothetical protein
MNIEYVLSKQQEWADIYNEQRRIYKSKKARAEKQRVKERKGIDVENIFSTDNKCQTNNPSGTSTKKN